MASPHKALPRRLFEVLEEQQEPFFLDVCLLDSGFPERTVQSRATLSCWRPRRKKGGSWRCLPTKMRYWEVVKRALNWSSRAPHYRRWSISDCFAKTRSTSRVGGGFHRLSCSSASTEVKLNRDEYELSPVSVFDVHSDEDSSVHNHSTEEEKQSSSSLGSPSKAGNIVNLTPFPLFKEAKREVPLPEEKACVWENQWGDLALMTSLISLDIDESGKSWSQFQDQRREIGMQIEGFILEELREECVLDML